MNTRFTVAAHILTLLAVFKDQALTSDFIAGSVETNPVVIRRLLGRLRDAGLVSALPGPGGGFVLTANPTTLTLLDVYQAVAERGLIAVHPGGSARCPVGRNIGSLLDEVTSQAEDAMLESLRATTVAALAQRVARFEKNREGRKTR